MSAVESEQFQSIADEDHSRDMCGRKEVVTSKWFFLFTIVREFAAAHVKSGLGKNSRNSSGSPAGAFVMSALSLSRVRRPIKENGRWEATD